MTNPTVWFCEINLENGARPARETLEQDSNLDVIGYGCLKRCRKCDRKLYAVVDGNIVEAESSQDLVQNIYEFIGAR
ncbi:DUF1450 domain-containing protein [Niallia sp. XMNu-256]|uniref:DUF1450 domain-containing protein n=1 Tax=Niallia sp. XMNu-256 TaxID=3082444 RepID=UPI0030D1CA86